MASLGGRNLRTIVTSLEVLADNGEDVLMFDRIEEAQGGGVKIRTRKVWESPWSYDGATFMVGRTDADILAKIVGGTDAQYQLGALQSISASDFTGKNPNVVDEDAVAKEVEARCSQLDIERAKAANLAEEKEVLARTLTVQHMDNKHDRDVEGCVMCENRIRPGHGDGSFVDEPFAESMPSVDADDL